MKKQQPTVMISFPARTGFLVTAHFVLLIAGLTLGGLAGAASSANFSTDMLDLAVDEDGSVTFSGDDGGKRLKFVWVFPEELSVSRGDKANLKKFKVNRRKRELKIRTDRKGAFLAKIFLSSDTAGTYVLSNKKASISFSPDDVTITVGGSGPRPDPGPTPTPVTSTFTLRVCEGVSWEIRRNMVLSDLYLFGDGSCSRSPTLPGPELRVAKDDIVSIRFINDASNSKDHALIIPGLDVAGAGVAVAPGEEKTYILPTNTPGTFFYAAAELDGITPTPNRREIDRGMYGGIVVKSANERFVRPEFDAIRFFDEIPRVVAGGDITFDTHTIDTVPGEPGHEPPTYHTHEFLVHGKTIDSKVDGNNLESVALHGAVGEDMVMRLICVGSETHALHLHGHLTDTTADGRTTGPDGAADTVPTDVVRCPFGDVRNVYVSVRAPGTWVWHCHRETHLLNNLDADYPGGMFTHLEVSGGGDDDD